MSEVKQQPYNRAIYAPYYNTRNENIIGGIYNVGRRIDQRKI